MYTVASIIVVLQLLLVIYYVAKEAVGTFSHTWIAMLVTLVWAIVSLGSAGYIIKYSFIHLAS